MAAIYHQLMTRSLTIQLHLFTPRRGGKYQLTLLIVADEQQFIVQTGIFLAVDTHFRRKKRKSPEPQRHEGTKDDFFCLPSVAQTNPEKTLCLRDFVVPFFSGSFATPLKTVSEVITLSVRIPLLTEKPKTKKIPLFEPAIFSLSF